MFAAAKFLQSCLTLCDPIDGSPAGSPVPGILQARTLEWGAIAFSHRMFLAALFTIAKIQKLPRSPLTDEGQRYGTYIQWNTTQP